MAFSFLAVVFVASASAFFHHMRCLSANLGFLRTASSLSHFNSFFGDSDFYTNKLSAGGRKAGGKKITVCLRILGLTQNSTSQLNTLSHIGFLKDFKKMFSFKSETIDFSYCLLGCCWYMAKQIDQAEVSWQEGDGKKNCLVTRV